MSDLVTKIILTKKLENVDGSMDEKTLGKLLSEMLLSETAGDPVKLYTWGTMLRKENIVELDGSDFKTLYEIVKNSQRVVVSARAQILILMDEAKGKVKTNKGQ